MQTVWAFIKIISIPDEKLFSKRPPDELLHNLWKIFGVPFSLITLTSPTFEQVS